MSDVDLSDPQHLADILQATLPGFTEETPGRVAAHVEALEKSDADVFSHIGTGRRADEDEPVESPSEGEEPAGPPPSPDGEDLPLDLGGEGELIEDTEPEIEIGGVPVRARRGWNEFDRVRAKGRHEIYSLAASHKRERPIRSVFTGRCQAVRVRLPAAKPANDAFIGTWIGVVEAKDHLLFSVAEAEEAYERQFGRKKKVERLDLITGARFRGRRFSPVSVFLAYGSDAPTAKPIFYMLEGGSASGNPESLYVSERIDTEILAKADFEFTPFSCNANWYNGGLAMNADLTEPACVYLDASQIKSGARKYMHLSVTYDRDLELERVVHPFELQVEAAVRVMTIADEMGCQLRTGAGGVLQHSLGPVARALMPWDEPPNGTTTSLERKTYCGCPEH